MPVPGPANIWQKSTTRSPSSGRGIRHLPSAGPRIIIHVRAAKSGGVWRGRRRSGAGGAPEAGEGVVHEAHVHDALEVDLAALLAAPDVPALHVAQALHVDPAVRIGPGRLHALQQRAVADAADAAHDLDELRAVLAITEEGALVVAERAQVGDHKA